MAMRRRRHRQNLAYAPAEVQMLLTMMKGKKPNELLSTPPTTPRKSPAAPPKAPPASDPAPTETKPLKSILKKRAADPASPPKESKRAKRKRAAPANEETEAPQASSEAALLITAGTYDGTIAGWAFEISKAKFVPLFTSRAHQGYVSSLALGGKHLVSSGSDEVLAVYNVRRLKEVGSCGSEGTPTKMHMMGTNVLCTTSTGVVHIYRTSDWMTIWSEHGHKKRINDIALHPGGALGLTVGEDSFLKVWDFAKCKLALQVKLPKPPTLVGITPCGSMYCFYTHPVLHVHNLADGKKVNSVELPSEVHSMAFVGPDALLTGTEDGSLSMVKVTASGTTVAWTEEAHPMRVKAISLVPESESGSAKLVVTACSGGSLVVWRTDGTVSPLQRVGTLNFETRYTCVAAGWRPQ